MQTTIFAELVEKEQLKPDIYKFSVQAKPITDLAKPGHFLEIKVSDTNSPFLRRPISIFNMDKEKGLLEFIFQVKGKGTEILARKEIGDVIDIIGPLGNGTFEYEGYKNISIIGGGIGVFPLYELAKNARTNSNVNIYLGFRNKDFVVLEDEFKKVSDRLVITTDDGSYAQKGFAINFLKEDITKSLSEHANEDFVFTEGKGKEPCVIKKQRPDCIYACGPLPMLKAVRELAIDENIPCQISLEEKMGCGMGACLGCAVSIVDGEEPRYGHVCKEGPVFQAKDVEI